MLEPGGETFRGGWENTANATYHRNQAPTGYTGAVKVTTKHPVLHSPFVRNFRSGDLFEAFLVTAAVTILMVRGYLALTGYPQLGNDVLHIAHVLPGGLLMAAAIVLTLGYLNKEARTLAAIFGGIGFGLFIDELGKFLTKDVNYFFEPTVALIYIIFICLFLVFRWIGDRKATEQEYVINAMEMAKEVSLHDFDKSERKMALTYLRKGDQTDPTIRALRDLLNKIEPSPDSAPDIVMRVRRRLARRYRALIRRPWFNNVVVTIFVAGGLLGLLDAVLQIGTDFSTISFSEWGVLLSTGLSGIFVLIGTFHQLGGRRLQAYLDFRRSVLVHIFITQFFIFYQEQFVGLVALLWSLLVLLVLQYAIKQERYGD